MAREYKTNKKKFVLRRFLKPSVRFRLKKKKTVKPHKKNKTNIKWNHVHFFQKEKKDSTTKGKFREHPALIFGQSKRFYKAVVFTKNPTTDGQENLQLKYNIDPDSCDPCYGVPYRGARLKSDFQPPGKKYRIHPDDNATVKILKAGKKKK